ncbi:MAG: outer membrane lipoprotein carrier protein LolA [Candidatus Contendobacter sp.]|jgi:outer membrane lipoprotein-sorting protein|nr:outer membrane lipoprotein carrier protein LolA [Gammaproteobacteria bacterium]MCC8992806.1 outer membrane lipoprotein carrier protein LolA [Candidatus Contendobacter sp.]
MKRWFAVLLAVLLLCWPLAAVIADEALTEVMRTLAAVKSLQAEFREEKTLAMLQQPLVTTGRLYYQAPAYLRKQTLQPQPEDYTANGEWLTLDTPEGGQRDFNLNGYPQLRPFVEAIRATQAGDQATLERYYRLEFQGTPADWTLRLTPLDPTAAGYVAAIVMHGKNERIVSVETLEPDGDRSLMIIDLTTIESP